MSGEAEDLTAEGAEYAEVLYIQEDRGRSAQMFMNRNSASSAALRCSLLPDSEVSPAKALKRWETFAEAGGNELLARIIHG